MNTFVPPEYLPNIWEPSQLVRLSLLTDMQRKSHVVRTDYTAEELAARKTAVDAWTQLTDELIVKGWLEDGYCTECGGGPEPSTETVHLEVVYDETEDAYKQRLALKDGDKIRITTVARD